MEKTNLDYKQRVKGTLDYDDQSFKEITFLSGIIRQECVKLGAEEISTPTLEHTQLLLDKYGEEAETKLIYKMEDLALRYDLTVPLMRYIVNNKIDRMKRFQVGTVFRRDNPNPISGRFREFYQADYDIIGEYDHLIPETELLKLIDTVLGKLEIKDYVIKINFRRNLEKIITLSEIDQSLDFKSICATIDKLDKVEWTNIQNELITKGVSTTSCYKLKSYLDQNYIDPEISPDFDLLSRYLQIQKVKNVKFDASLARGLDYYTGIIYEVCLTTQSSKCQNIGSIIAGGRYDKVICMNKKKNRYNPAIGVSFGINRLKLCDFTYQKPKSKSIYVISNDLDKRFEIIHVLQTGSDLKIGYHPISGVKIIRQITFGVKNDYDFIVIYGENEELVCLKSVADNSPDTICRIDNLISVLANML